MNSLDSDSSMFPPFLAYDFSSQVEKPTQQQIDDIKKQREKLQKMHEGALQIDVWEGLE